MKDREANLVLALLVGILALAGPRRTRPLSAFLYGLFLSRAHGAGARRVERTVVGLFDQRKSVIARVDVLEALVDGLVTAAQETA